jgi:hypothetical protein
MNDWEAAVHQVVLSGRTDDIDAMAKPWTAVVGDGGELDYLQQQLQNLAQSLANHWQGDAATLCTQKVQNMIKAIGDLRETYSTEVTMLRVSRDALIDAKKSIPIPVVVKSLLNGENADGRGATLYTDYQRDPGTYGDFRTAAVTNLMSYARQNGMTEQLYAQQWRGSRQAEYNLDVNTANRQSTDAADLQAFLRRVADAWYSEVSPRAAKAFDNLRTEYAQHASRLPRLAGESIASTHGAGDRSGSGRMASGTGAVTPIGTGTTGPLGSTPSSSAWVAPRSGDTAQPSISTGSVAPSSGDVADTVHAGPTGLSGLGSAEGVSASGGVGMGGSGPAAGAGRGSVFRDTAAIGSSPMTEPIGQLSDVQSFLPKGFASSGRSPSSGGLGMMGMPGSTGRDRERDEHTTWLTEDEDIWGTRPDLPPAVLGEPEDRGDRRDRQW